MEIKAKNYEKKNRLLANNKITKRSMSLPEYYCQHGEIISVTVSLKRGLKMNGSYRKRLTCHLNDKALSNKTIFYSTQTNDNMLLFRRNPHPYKRSPGSAKCLPTYKTLKQEQSILDETKANRNIIKAVSLVDDSSTVQETYRPNITEDGLNVPLLEDEDTSFLEDSSNVGVQITDLILTLQHTETLFQSRQIIPAASTKQLVLPSYRTTHVYIDLQCYTHYFTAIRECEKYFLQSKIPVTTLIGDIQSIENKMAIFMVNFSTPVSNRENCDMAQALPRNRLNEYQACVFQILSHLINYLTALQNEQNKQIN